MSPNLVTALVAVGLTAVTVAVALWSGTGPRRIGRHLAAYPGTLLVGAANGTFAALGAWVLGMLVRVDQPPLRLAVDAAGWLLLHVVLEAAPGGARFSAENPARPKTARTGRRRAPKWVPVGDFPRKILTATQRTTWWAGRSPR